MWIWFSNSPLRTEFGYRNLNLGSERTNLHGYRSNFSTTSCARQTGNSGPPCDQGAPRYVLRTMRLTPTETFQFSEMLQNRNACGLFLNSASEEVREHENTKKRDGEMSKLKQLRHEWNEWRRMTKVCVVYSLYSTIRICMDTALYSRLFSSRGFCESRLVWRVWFYVVRFAWEIFRNKKMAVRPGDNLTVASFHFPQAPSNSCTTLAIPHVKAYATATWHLWHFNFYGVAKLK